MAGGFRLFSGSRTNQGEKIYIITEAGGEAFGYGICRTRETLEKESNKKGSYAIVAAYLLINTGGGGEDRTPDLGVMNPTL